MSLGYGDDGFGVGDSPRPGERAEDPRYVDQRPRLTECEYLRMVKAWGEVAKASKEKKS